VRIKVVLAAGLVLIAVAVLATLLHSPATVASTNGVQPSAMLMSAKGNAAACQSRETIPAGTTAVRLQVVATTGPQVSVEVLRGGHVVTHGVQGTAWYGAVVTVPVRRVSRAVKHATVCFQLRDLSGQVEAYGTQTSAATAARANGAALPGRVTISYLRAGQQSWWSLAGGVIEHMELGRAESGSWIVIVIAALAAAAIALGVWTVNRELG
jgi:hypothetical protein